MRYCDIVVSIVDVDMIFGEVSISSLLPRTLRNTEQIMLGSLVTTVFLAPVKLMVKGHLWFTFVGPQALLLAITQ